MNSIKKIFQINKKKNEEIERIFTNLYCEDSIAGIYIYPIFELHCYLVKIDILHDHNFEHKIEYYQDISLKEISFLLENLTKEELENNDDYIEFLTTREFTEWIGPSLAFDIVLNKVKYPLLLQDIFRNSLRSVTFLLKNNPIEFFADKPKLEDFLTQNYEVYHSDTFDEPLDDANESGSFIFINPPQLFGKFEKVKGREYYDFSHYKLLDYDEIIFEKYDVDFGYFILWRYEKCYQSKTKIVESPIEFANLFLFYLKINHSFIEIITNDEVIPIEQKTLEFCRKGIVEYSRIYNPGHHDPLKSNFLRKYWFIDETERKIMNQGVLERKEFEKAYNFVKKIWKFPILRNYFIQFFESLTFLKRKQFKQAFLTVWIIIEEILDLKWTKRTLSIFDLKIKLQKGEDEILKKFRKDFKSRTKSFQFYTTSTKIDQLFLYGEFDSPTYALLRELNSSRNKLAHRYKLESTDLVNYQYSLLINWLFEQYSTELATLEPEFSKDSLNILLNLLKINP